MAPKRCLEFLLQCGAMGASCGAIIAAIFVQMKYNELDGGQRRDIDDVSNDHSINEIYVKTQATAGIVFASTGMAVLIGIVALIGRIFTSKENSQNRRLYSSLYMLYLLVCFLTFATAGVLGAFTAIDWSTIVRYNPSNDFEDLRNSVAATSACSLFTSLIYAVLELVVLFCCSANKHY